MKLLLCLALIVRNPYAIFESLWLPRFNEQDKDVYDSAIVVGSSPNAESDLLGLLSTLKNEKVFIVFINHCAFLGVIPNMIVYESSDDISLHRSRLALLNEKNLPKGVQVKLHSSFKNLAFRNFLYRFLKKTGQLDCSIFSRSNYPSFLANDPQVLRMFLSFFYSLPILKRLTIWYRSSVASIALLLGFRYGIKRIYLVGSPMSQSIYNGGLKGERFSAVISVVNAKEALHYNSIYLDSITNPDSPLHQYFN